MLGAWEGWRKGRAAKAVGPGLFQKKGTEPQRASEQAEVQAEGERRQRERGGRGREGAEGRA